MDIYLARQPILDLDNEIYGYELLYRSNKNINSYTGVDGDESTADVITNAFFDMHMRSMIGNKKAFINFTGNLLKRGVPKMLPPETLVIEILENIIIDEDVLDAVAELKDLGYTIALDDFMFKRNLRDIFELGDIIKIDFRMPTNEIEETSYICKYSNKIMLAEKVETLQEVEYAKRLGCVYMQGYYFAKPVLMSRRSTVPLSGTYMQILQLVSSAEPDIDAITDVISRDAALTQRLLRLINSVYFGFNSKIASVSQALMLLGLEHLREWIYLMGLRRVFGTESLQILENALFRATFCEGIGKLMNKPKRDQRELYLMGLLSIIPETSDKTIPNIMDEFPVTDNIKNGIKGVGVYGDIFRLTINYELGKWNLVDEFSLENKIDRSDISSLYVKSIQSAKSLDLFFG